MDGGCGFLEKSNKREIDALEKEGGQGITRRSDGTCGDEWRRSANAKCQELCSARTEGTV